MKLTQHADTVRQLIDVPGLLSGRLEHKIAETSASVQWTGPKIGREAWNEVLAFFRHVAKTSHSEAQVRAFVFRGNPKHWAFWAFPQKACSGLSARELDTEDSKQQWQQWPGGQWLPWGTIHSHVNIAAFQSGTDEHDEKHQDGLHITIGKLDAPLFDLHARLYHCQNKFEPDLSWFWDVGEAARFLPGELHGLAARFQMCTPPPDDTPIRPEWLANVIEVQETRSILTPVGWESSRSEGGGSFFSSNSIAPPKLRQLNRVPDIERALTKIEMYLEENPTNEPEDVLQCLDDLACPLLQELAVICYIEDVDPAIIAQAFENELTESKAPSASHPADVDAQTCWDGIGQ